MDIAFTTALTQNLRCKTLCPLKCCFLSHMFCITGLVSSKKVAQMYVEEIHFRNCYLNGFGTFDPGDFDL